MLRTLSIRNIALIEALDLEFQAGLNVLTGETGAGKSILLDALGFALGRKSRRNMVRSGGDQGSVTAVFDCPDRHPIRDMLRELGFPADNELILRRSMTEGGPARAFINDQRANAETLARLGERLVEVHGQHDDTGLLNPRAHRPMLDAAGGLEADVAALRSLWSMQEDRRRALADARAMLTKATEDADYLRHSVEELRSLAPEAGEDDKLDIERRLIQSAVRLVEEIAKARLELNEGAEDAMSNALSRLTHLTDRAEGLLDGAITAIDRAMAELGEAERGLQTALDTLSFDPGRLEQVEERLFAIRGLARKHQVLPDELEDLSTDFAARLDAIDAGEDQISALDGELAEAQAAYRVAADKLSTARKKAATRIDKAVTRELAPLKMENARFLTEITPADAGSEGIDRVSFTAAINPGAPSGPIDRIASGGELSRFLLAMKVCLTDSAPDRVMVFDEIDRGVGGATAAAVGRRLARLAETTQVLVVTHSPQVAAEGAHHWQIAKTTRGEITRTDVGLLDREARIDEIARMLAGEQLTDAARSAALSLMQEAG